MRLFLFSLSAKVRQAKAFLRPFFALGTIGMLPISKALERHKLGFSHHY